MTDSNPGLIANVILANRLLWVKFSYLLKLHVLPSRHYLLGHFFLTVLINFLGLG